MRSDGEEISSPFFFGLFSGVVRGSHRKRWRCCGWTSPSSAFFHFGFESSHALPTAEVVFPSSNTGTNGRVFWDIGFAVGILYHFAVQFPFPCSTFRWPRLRRSYPPLDQIVEEDQQAQKDEESHDGQLLTQEALFYTFSTFPPSPNWASNWEMDFSRRGWI